MLQGEKTLKEQKIKKKLFLFFFFFLFFFWWWNIFSFILGLDVVKAPNSFGAVYPHLPLEHSFIVIYLIVFSLLFFLTLFLFTLTDLSPSSRLDFVCVWEFEDGEKVVHWNNIFFILFCCRFRVWEGFLFLVFAKWMLFFFLKW